MDGRIDGFTCAAGTGGTIAGVGMGLKAFDEHVTIALTDPHGAALYNYYAHGELKAEGTSVAEGIGQGRITANLEGAPIDTQFRISDEEGLEWVARLLAEEGLCLGLSSGINVAGAVALGRQLGKGSRGGHDPVRHRLPLSLLALQCRVAAGQGPAGLPLAGVIG
jgi:cysteine synthase A